MAHSSKRITLLIGFDQSVVCTISNFTHLFLFNILVKLAQILNYGMMRLATSDHFFFKFIYFYCFHVEELRFLKGKDVSRQDSKIPLDPLMLSGVLRHPPIK